MNCLNAIGRIYTNVIFAFCCLYTNLDTNKITVYKYTISLWLAFMYIYFHDMFYFLCKNLYNVISNSLVRLLHANEKADSI